MFFIHSKFSLSVGLLTLFIVLGCNKTNDKTLIAKVGDSELHLTDLENTRENVNDEEWQGAIQRWIEKQLLVQKAKALNLDKSDYLKKKMNHLENELLAKLVLDSLVKVSEPTDIQLKSFYETTKDQWTTKTVEVRGWVWRSTDQNTIQSLWRQTRTALSPAGGEAFDWTPIERLGPLESELERISIGIITQPKKWGNEWVFVQLDNRRSEGYSKPFAEVRNEVKSMYLSEQLQIQRDSIMKSLVQTAINKNSFYQISLQEFLNRKRDYEINLQIESEKKQESKSNESP